MSNPVFPGFPWNQLFSIDLAALGPGEKLRCDIRQNPLRDPLFSIGEVDGGITRTGAQEIQLSLTPAQTELLALGDALTDLVVDNGAATESRHLGIRLTFPVMASITVPK